MKIHPSTVVVPLAVVLLVGAAGAVLATPGGPSSPAAPAAQPAAENPTATAAPAATAKPAKPARDSALTDALDTLVADGTITAAQRQAVIDAVASERKVRFDAFKVKREEAKAQFKQVRTFLEDGVITQQEFDQLPADSHLRKLDSLMEDGKITTEELKELGRKLFNSARGHFWGGKGDKAAPTPSPAP